MQNTLVSGSTYNGVHARECWFDTKQCSYVAIVAQRYPWNGWLDIQYRTLRANESYDVVFYANGIELGTAPATDDKPAMASFNLNAIEAFRDKALKNVKITAKLVAAE